MTNESPPYSWESLAPHAMELLAKNLKLKTPLIVGHAEATYPETTKPIHQFTAVAADDANGPRYRIIVDDAGRPCDLTPELEALFDPAREVGKAFTLARIPSLRAAPVIIKPDQNILTLNLGDTVDETITVTIPRNSAAPKADVYFLADTTGSMGHILAAVQTAANNILGALSGLGVDLAFGVGNYKDFPSDPYAFQHQLNPTTVATDVTAAINTWTAIGGLDYPEGQLFALDSLAIPPGGSIGWRAGSKRIIVWFGDVPGHDPVCAAISGAPADITEASVTAKLTSESITVIAISTATPGLDGDPKASAGDYTAACGAPGGAPGQGTRLAAATGGVFATGINPGNIANTIVNLVSTAVATINNVQLVPSASIAPFVVSIAPPTGYGPLAGDQEHTLTFDVRFTGTIPCSSEAQVFGGNLDVVADGVTVATKRALITVPPCREEEFVYSVKFVCGQQPECPCECTTVQPGIYATDINIHNFQDVNVTVKKMVTPVVFMGAPVGREPNVARPRASDTIVLPPHSATMDDCCGIAELLLGGKAPAPMLLTVGFLEIRSSRELAVTAVYTASDAASGSLSIDVEQIEPATSRRS